MSFKRELDAVMVSPETHKVVFENDKLRVVEVTIQPGQKEPLHTHPYKNVMIVENPSTITYYDRNGAVMKEVKVEGVSFLEPADEHATQNTGGEEFKAFRIELK